MTIKKKKNPKTQEAKEEPNDQQSGSTTVVAPRVETRFARIDALPMTLATPCSRGDAPVTETHQGGFGPDWGCCSPLEPGAGTSRGKGVGGWYKVSRGPARGAPQEVHRIFSTRTCAPVYTLICVCFLSKVKKGKKKRREVQFTYWAKYEGRSKSRPMKQRKGNAFWEEDGSPQLRTATWQNPGRIPPMEFPVDTGSGTQAGIGPGKAKTMDKILFTWSARRCHCRQTFPTR